LKGDSVPHRSRVLRRSVLEFVVTYTAFTGLDPMNKKVHNLSLQNTVLNQYMAEIRDISIQTDRMRFRRNLERVGEILAYEISKTLPYKARSVTTPLAETECSVLQEQPVLATILRAGLPLHQGLLNYFDQAENCFISAFRMHHEDDDAFDVKVEYLASPNLQDKTVILCDPMLATGSSMVLAYKALLERGTPKKIHVVTVIASEQAVNFVQQNLPAETTIWAAAIDNELTSRSYIVPGLGDAGDLAYGDKT
jgi:uracil phosphoribosyltransferase